MSAVERRVSKSGRRTCRVGLCPDARRRRLGRARLQRGSAVAGFVLCSLVLLPLFFAILQLALVWHVRTTLVSAATEGAHYGAAYDRDLDDGRRRTADVIRQQFGNRLDAEVDAHQTSDAGQPVVDVSVTARVPVLAFWGPRITLHVDGHAVKEILP